MSGLIEDVNYIKKRSSLFEEVIKASSLLLYNHPIAEKTLYYLNKRISNSNQLKFEFGYFPSDEFLDTLFSMVDKEKLYELHLLYNKYIADGDLTTAITCGSLGYHNLIMPYKDLYGNIVALVGRSLHSEDERKILKIPKYKNTTFTKSTHLFGLNFAKKSILAKNSVLIVEGQIDCITASSYGYHNVVALGGVAFSPYQFHMLRRYTDNFNLVLDNDAEGKSSANKIKNRFGHLANIKIISVPNQYKDLDECLNDNCFFLE